MNKHKYSANGFTIVELLIVIVVIAVLATITIVAFNGIQQRTRATAATTGLTQAKKKLEIYKTENGTYPTSGNLAVAGVSEGATTYQYTSDGAGFCITATNGSVSYKATDSASSSSGGCAGHGQGGTAAVTNYVANPSAEVNITGWVAPGNQAPAIARSTVTAQSGTASLRIYYNGTYNTDGNQQQVRQDVPGLIVGQQYTASAYVLPNAGKRLMFYLNDGIGNGLGSILSNTSAAWQRLTLTFTAPTTTISMRFHAAEASGSGLHTTVTDYTTSPYTGYIDSVMVSATNGAVGYADGNSADWVWNGPANNSTSTGPTL